MVSEELKKELKCDLTCSEDCCSHPPTLAESEVTIVTEALEKLGIQNPVERIGSYAHISKSGDFCAAFDWQNGQCLIHDSKIKPTQCIAMFCARCRGTSKEEATIQNKAAWQRLVLSLWPSEGGMF